MMMKNDERDVDLSLLRPTSVQQTVKNERNSPAGHLGPYWEAKLTKIHSTTGKLLTIWSNKT